MAVIRQNILNIEAAIRAYYGNGYIGNAEIREIFGPLGSGTISKMKRAVREEEARQGVPIVVLNHLNVRVAYEVWGIDIDELVRNRKKLIALNLA